MGRTGTTTIAKMLGAFRSAHEPEAPKTIDLLGRYWNDDATDAEVFDALEDRDRRHRLEFESSPFLGAFAPFLKSLFPQAKFILTVREPRDWLRSAVDKCLNDPRSELGDHYVKLRDLCYGVPPCKREKPEPERQLEGSDIHLLNNFLKYWSWHNDHVLGAIPQERLLIVPTGQLGNAGGKIARFLGVKPGGITNPARQNVASRRHGVLELVDENHIESLITEHCSETARTLSQRISGNLGWSAL